MGRIECIYDYPAPEGVTTSNFMTADWVKIPYGILFKVYNCITNEVRYINRVVFGITQKPPSTIEWE